MSGEFIDTNVFIYLFDETDDRKRGTADPNGAGIPQRPHQSPSRPRNPECRDPEIAVAHDGGRCPAFSGTRLGALMARYTESRPLPARPRHLETLPLQHLRCPYRCGSPEIWRQSPLQRRFAGRPRLTDRQSEIRSRYCRAGRVACG